MIAVACVASSSAVAQQKAGFIDGTYTMSAQACRKLQALAKGGPRSINTVPWSVDRNGFSSWEGGCGFTRITEKRKDSVWQVDAVCEEGPDKSKESYTFARRSDGSFDVTLRGERKSVRYTRCDVGKGK